MIIIKETIWEVLTHKYEVYHYDYNDNDYKMPFWVKVLTFIYPPMIAAALESSYIKTHWTHDLFRSLVLVFQIICTIIFMLALYLSFSSSYSVSTNEYDMRRAEERAIRLFEEKQEKKYRAYVLNHMKNCTCDTTHTK